MIKKVLILCYSDHSKEPRLIMQCNALCASYAITTAGYFPYKKDGINFLQLNGNKSKAPFLFHLNKHKIIRAPFTFINKLYYKLTNTSSEFQKDDFLNLSNYHFDAIICHHPATLELAFKLKSKFNSKIIFNAHEIYPFEFEENKEWMDKNFEPNDNILKKYVANCDSVFTVNEEICDFYKKRYGGNCIAILNSKPYHYLTPSPISNPIKIIHHGGAMPRRKLEHMAEAVIRTNGLFELTFMLINNTSNTYLQQLKDSYQSKGIKFIDAVPYKDIITTINQFDIGIHILPNENINQKLALPNKLFEFIQARLAIVSAPNLAMKTIVESNKIGLITENDTVEAITKALLSLDLNAIRRYKNNTEHAAIKYSSAKDEERILSTIDKLLNN